MTRKKRKRQQLAQRPVARPESTSAPAAAADAALAWLGTLAEGDAGAAWARLAPASKDHWDDDPALFDADSGAAEVFSAWGEAAPEILLSTTISEDDDGAVEVVTLVADVAQEGGVATRALALPVRVTPDGVLVDPWSAGDSRIQPVQPAASDGDVPVMAADAELAVIAPAACESLVLRLDAGPVVFPGAVAGTSLVEDPAGLRATYQPGEMAPGDHVLTAACLDSESGGVVALGAPFSVE